MFLIILAVISIASTVISMIMRAKPLVSTLGDFQFPTATEGRAIPVAFGTVKISGGNTVWWGDLQVRAVRHTSLLLHIAEVAFTFQNSHIIPGSLVGYKYLLGIQYVLCQGPVDAWISLECDGKQVPLSDVSGTDRIHAFVEANKFWGGDPPNGAGGLRGNIFFYRGTNTQNGDDYLSQKQTATAFQEGGVPPTFSGVGNGGLAFVAPGTAAQNETITITATGSFYTADHTKPYYLAREFTVVGSLSGSIGTAYANYAFGSSRINFTIQTGSIDFVPGDHWTIGTLTARQSPNFRGICYVVFDTFYVGISASPRPFSFVVRRCPDPLGMGPSIANLNGDANGAFIIYDWLTSERYGLGILPARIDAGSFESAATTLATEGLGLSMLFDSQSPADQIIGEVLRHIDGVLYVDMATGLWTLKLARSDYDPTTIPEITADDIEKIQYSRPSWLETSNQVTLSYVERGQDFNIRTVKAEDNGNIAITGDVRTENVTFNGLSNGASAALVTARCLKAFSHPTAKVTLTVNRKAWSYRQGGVFKLTWVPLGIVGQIFRIARIGYGEVASGKITIDAVEDIFGLQFTLYDAPPQSGWVNPTGAPTAPAFQRLEEVPLELSPTAGIYAMTLVARAEGTDQKYLVYQPVSGNDTETNENAGFTPLGLLEGTYLAMTPALDATGFKVQANGIDLNALANTDAGGLAQGKNLALIEEEFVSWETTTLNFDGTISIAGVIRGVFDTVPVDHGSGAIVLFVTDGAGFTQPTPYGSDQTVQAKILPENNAGTFPLTSASYQTVTTRSRFLRPYPPGNVCMQSQPYATRFTTTIGDVTITWSSRNRLTQAAAGVMVHQDQGTIAGETGQIFKVVVVIGGSTIRTVNPATTPFTYAATDRVTDGGLGPVTLQIFSNANSLDSFQAQIVRFEMTGFGLDFGNFFGGLQA